MPESDNSASRISSYACPNCNAKLIESENKDWFCENCKIAFPVVNGPVVNGNVPILVTAPKDYVAGERYILQHDSAQLQATGDYYLQVAENAGIRKETLLQLSQGLIHNSKLLAELAAMLPETQVEIEEHQLSLGADLFVALRKDWSGSDETESELNQTFTAINEILQEVRPQRTLVLGAGTGRMLCEIAARYPETFGIDLSATMGMAFAKLSVDCQLDAYLLHQGNFLRTADESELIHAQRQLSSGSPNYAIANASALPFEDSSFDAIISNYFTDMLPLSMWLSEVKRVLKKDGTFIHFGPLGYAFPQIEEHFAVDQLPAAFAQYGLSISQPKFQRGSFYGSANRLNRFDFDNLIFVGSHR